VGGVTELAKRFGRKESREPHGKGDQDPVSKGGPGKTGLRKGGKKLFVPGKAEGGAFKKKPGKKKGGSLSSRSTKAKPGDAPLTGDGIEKVP